MSKVEIDIEDSEQVERLTKALVEAAFRHGNTVVSDQGIHADTTAAALRTFADGGTWIECPTFDGQIVEVDR
jgi:hypothetical protein